MCSFYYTCGSYRRTALLLSALHVVMVLACWLLVSVLLARAVLLAFFLLADVLLKVRTFHFARSR
jgi:hypothetical protein